MPDSPGATPIPTAGLAEVDEAAVAELHGMDPSALETLREALEAHDLSFDGGA